MDEKRYTKEGLEIMGEECYCDHIKFHHYATLVPGHGSCAVLGCSCNKFTWKNDLLRKPD